MAQPRPICCEINAVGGGDLPADLRLGDIESLLLPLCAAQRLVAIELQHSPDMQSIPGAVVEFATEADAAACAGQRELKGMAVELTVRHNTPFKRTRDGDDGSGGSRRRGSEDKERRLNRVGLSYTCGICGKPKKGHVCTGAPDGKTNADGTAATPAPASAADASPAAPASAPAPASRSRSKAKAEASGGSGGGSGAKEKGSGGRSASGGGGRKRGGARGAQEEKGKLLDEIDLAMHRPPSVITPEDGNLNGNLNGLAGPSSMPSASDMFSPGTLMQHLLGTPTPQQGVPVPAGGAALPSAGTPGGSGSLAGLATPGGTALSPGTLHALGSGLSGIPSPASALASASKRQRGSTRLSSSQEPSPAFKANDIDG